MSLKSYSTPTYWQRVKVACQYLFPQLPITRLAGWLAEQKWGMVTHFIIRIFAKQYNVNLAEAEKTNPADYTTFNEFFLRPLKENARPINQDDQAVCLPADGKISELGQINENRLLQAKGHYFTLETLLANDEEMAESFKNGSFITTYLSPRDYHRVHMPCDATLKKMIYVPGDLFSVNSFLAEHIPNLFARNERVICEFETAFGPMVQILVGATITASISTVWAGIINPPRSKDVVEYNYQTTGETAIHLKKGDEMGAFRLGSTVINLFPQATVELVSHLQAGVETRMGERFAKIIK
ncbi:phosphatidylserine decarboxylase [[Haemophilus] ducreyi]|uniref:Phosphatidylserine decarboxylase proenzyme n=2 Tax=Haemophilus ducreyi TaxID=730 RepID=PSD_HAEDU|nr:archaetidylserine decarboxylase [[Haemophilus] ducreyi]Q7VNA7.1 RecName: Full=Phosphatidylserine decarboxylase proenzyme; Contains: RecName: Full=Phosphatidylserine decarboxylase alpha chain; Contains: RecName: Full=Phosphatidylserine decarboxylase beta chain [[Haemophilus] ducreyi 35000HP]AAP95574.1 phosphatidylserine decarboxylase [[Haemophilus] ducreyi 35000HP]AKO30653.1 phosphatidylserine decarboxylase [[Haemophilus] ducreyi]AKO32090.1 phosphatidylserine decarboxylase [[Haemophilus] ducr